jgi:hypothetical protein
MSIEDAFKIAGGGSIIGFLNRATEYIDDVTLLVGLLIIWTVFGAFVAYRMLAQKK